MVIAHLERFCPWVKSFGLACFLISFCLCSANILNSLSEFERQGWWQYFWVSIQKILIWKFLSSGKQFLALLAFPFAWKTKDFLSLLCNHLVAQKFRPTFIILIWKQYFKLSIQKDIFERFVPENGFLSCLVNKGFLFCLCSANILWPRSANLLYFSLWNLMKIS